MCSRTRIPFTTCFGVMHVRNALLTIIILQLLGETIETLQYIFSDAPYVTDTIEFLFEIIETLTLVSTIYAWWKEKKEFVVPLFIQSILASMLTLLSTVLFFISIFFPYTAAANAFIPPAMVDETEMNRRIFFLMCFVFLTPIAALFGWFVMTAMGAYQYYDHKEKLEAFRRSRPLPSLHDPVPSDGTPKSLALVIPSAVSTEPSIEIPPTGNFANPNFSDEEEEEQELFGGRGGRSEMV